MDNLQAKNSVESLAKRIVQDMRDRGLRPKDQYLIAKEACVLFNENIIAVHRAMKMLADRGILVRQRRKGTFVGPNFKPASGPQNSTLSCVHVTMSMAYYQTSGVPAKDLINGIKSVLPLIPIQIHYLPGNDDLGYLKRVIDEIKEKPGQEGILMIHSTREMQEYAFTAKSLTAVFGGVYPGISGIPWVDVDQEQTGKIMARYALDKNHEKFALLMRDEWRSGDNLLHSGITSVLGDAGMSMNSLTTISVPVDIDIIATEIRNLLNSPDRPTAILCRGDYYADIVVETAKSMDLEVGKDILVISGGHLREEPSQDYAYVEPKLNSRQQVQALIKKLCAIARGQKKQEDHLIIPVEIKSPFNKNP
ncbi:MAG: substrate-binding domain-containing protein [Phycisphaerae bacterium]|nr:substrate-binding domain-containing protein [Phycisphaerae bacterium]